MVLGRPDLDPGGQNDLQKYKSYEMLDVIFLRAEGFSRNFYVLYEGRGINKLQFFW